MKTEFRDGTLFLYLEGRIDSSNASNFEQDVFFELSAAGGLEIIFDAENLEYISSAGLRVLMKVRRKQGKPPRIDNVSDEIFDILETTGFTELFQVRRKMRHISLKGCQRISSSLNGEYFSLTDDEMVKVYGKDVPLSVVYRERELARASMIAGVPTLIPYDVVMCGDRYGIIYEKTGADAISHILAQRPEETEQIAADFAATMQELHEIRVTQDIFPDIKTRYVEWINEARGLLSDQELNEIANLIHNLPDRETWVNGNLDLNSILLLDGEPLLVDVAGSANGHPIFDMQCLFAELMATPKQDPGYPGRTYGITTQICNRFWLSYFEHYVTDGSKEVAVSMHKLMAKSYVLKQKLIAALEKKNGGAS